MWVVPLDARRHGCVGVVVEVADLDEEVSALEADLARDDALVGVVVLLQREGGEVALGVAVGVDVDGILKISSYELLIVISGWIDGFDDSFLKIIQPHCRCCAAKASNQ